jgi:hypothetical protein
MRFIVVALIVSSFFSSCTREEELGTITGRITGEDGNPILGISVHAVLNGKVVGWGRSELGGVYVITGLKPGVYTVKAWGIGYEDSIRDGVVVEAGKVTAGVDFVMKKKGSEGG